MSNLTTHEAEQAAITAQWESCRANATPCEQAQQIMDETSQSDDSNTRRAARVLLAIAPAYDDDTTETGIQDALTDLMHLCDVAGWGFQDMIERARRNYAREVIACGEAKDEALRQAIKDN